MKKIPTIRDVAATAGVSVAVVSRVLNDGTGPVAAATRDRVLTAISELGYHPRAAAQSLNGNSATIGLIVADLINPFFARLADRLVWDARLLGIQVTLMTTQEDAHLEREILERLQDRSVAGIIATPTGSNLAAWQRLSEMGIVVSFVDRALPEIGCDLVRIENVDSAAEATNHLLDLGHQRIGLISGPMDTSTGADRVAGYRAALTARGVPFRSEYVHAVRFRGDLGGEAVGSLLGLHPAPTAIIVANTAQVHSAVSRIVQSRMSMPEDLSLVVFDDNPWTQLVSPPLTIVRPPIDILAAHSLDMVTSRMRGKVSEPARTVSVAAELVVRSSTARISAGAPGG